MSAASQGRGTLPPADRRIVVFAILLGCIAMVAAVAALGVSLGRSTSGGSGSDGASCGALAWNVQPRITSLPPGWTSTASTFSAEGFDETLVGQGPADGSAPAPTIYVRVSCFGSSARDLLDRSRKASIAAGGTPDPKFPDFGDDSGAIQAAGGGSTTVYILRGQVLANLLASSDVSTADLEDAAAAVDGGMAGAQGKVVPSRSPRPATPVPPSPSPDACAGASPAPSSDTALHALEAILPTSVNGTSLSTDSAYGNQALGADPSGQALAASLAGFGKCPVDLQMASAYDPNQTLDVQIIVFHLPGIDGLVLRKAVLDSWLTGSPSGVSSSDVTLGGKAVTHVSYGGGGVDDYLYVQGEHVFDIATADPAVATQVLTQLK